MKNVLMLGLLIGSFSAQAFVIVAGETGRMSCSREFRSNGPAAQGFACLVSTVTSLPTVVIEGQDLDVNSNEASFRLVAEANGNAEPQLIAHIAAEMNVSSEEVAAQVLRLQEMNAEISVLSVVQSL